jgi:hypothetical protein
MGPSSPLTCGGLPWNGMRYLLVGNSGKHSGVERWVCIFKSRCQRGIGCQLTLGAGMPRNPEHSKLHGFHRSTC